MRDRVLRNKLTLSVIAALLLLVGAVSLVRGWNLRYDFHHFYLDARYVWQHGQLNPDFTNADPDKRRQLPFYLPVVPLALAPLAAGGPKVAAVAWTLLQLLAAGYAASAVARRYTGRRQPAERAWVFLLAAVLMAPAAFEAARFNQLSFFVLALVLAGGGACERQKPLRAGFYFGLAAVLKLLPGLLLIWLLLKRKWAAAGSMVATVVIVALLPTWLVWGAPGVVRYHDEWRQYNLAGVLGRGMVDEGLRGHFVDYRNQSISAVVGRTLRADHPAAVPWQPLQLSKTVAAALALTIAAALGVALLLSTARSARRLPRDALRAELAVYLLALLVFSPLLRQYYLIWALPAISLASAWMIGGPTRPTRRAAALAVAAWTVGQAAWLSPTLRLYGVHLAMLIVVGALLLRAAQSAKEKRTME